MFVELFVRVFTGNEGVLAAVVKHAEAERPAERWKHHGLFGLRGHSSANTEGKNIQSFKLDVNYKDIQQVIISGA